MICHRRYLLLLTVFFWLGVGCSGDADSPEDVLVEEYAQFDTSQIVTYGLDDRGTYFLTVEESDELLEEWRPGEDEGLERTVHDLADMAEDDDHDGEMSASGSRPARDDQGDMHWCLESDDALYYRSPDGEYTRVAEARQRPENDEELNAFSSSISCVALDVETEEEPVVAARYQGNQNGGGWDDLHVYEYVADEWSKQHIDGNLYREGRASHPFRYKQQWLTALSETDGDDQALGVGWFEDEHTSLSTWPIQDVSRCDDEIFVGSFETEEIDDDTVEYEFFGHFTDDQHTKVGKVITEKQRIGTRPQTSFDCDAAGKLAMIYVDWSDEGRVEFHHERTDEPNTLTSVGSRVGRSLDIDPSGPALVVDDEGVAHVMVLGESDDYDDLGHYWRLNPNALR